MANTSPQLKSPLIDDSSGSISGGGGGGGGGCSGGVVGVGGGGGDDDGVVSTHCTSLDMARGDRLEAVVVEASRRRHRWKLKYHDIVAGARRSGVTLSDNFQ